MKVATARDEVGDDAATAKPHAAHTARSQSDTVKASDFNFLKVLGKGKLTKALTVKAHRFSASAKEAIEKAGGKIELLGVKAAA